MIEITEKLKVTAQEFFSQVIVSVLYDIKSATGKELSEAQLRKGYTYTKKMKNKVGRRGDVTVKITELQAPLRYSAEFKSYAGINKISYQMEEQEDGHIQVRYTEGYDGETKSQNLNYKLISVFYKRRAKKRTRQMLHAMEAYICQNRKEA